MKYLVNDSINVKVSECDGLIDYPNCIYRISMWLKTWSGVRSVMLKPLALQRSTRDQRYSFVIACGFVASITSPHMWLADGDSLMCYRDIQVAIHFECLCKEDLLCEWTSIFVAPHRKSLLQKHPNDHSNMNILGIFRFLSCLVFIYTEDHPVW